MGFFEFATGIVIASLFMNSLLFSFGLIDYSNSNFFYVAQFSTSTILNRDLNTGVITSNYLGGVVDQNSNASATGLIDSPIPFFQSLIANIPSGILTFASFPSWIVTAMIKAEMPKPIILMMGYPLMLIQIFAIFYFVRQVVSAFKGGG